MVAQQLLRLARGLTIYIWLVVNLIRKRKKETQWLFDCSALCSAL